MAKIFGTEIMSNSLLIVTCRKWIHFGSDSRRILFKPFFSPSSQNSFPPLSVLPIFKIRMITYQSKAIKHLYEPAVRRMPVRGLYVWESRIPRSILFDDLCGIEVHIASFRNRILI